MNLIAAGYFSLNFFRKPYFTFIILNVKYRDKQNKYNLIEKDVTPWLSFMWYIDNIDLFCHVCVSN